MDADIQLPPCSPRHTDAAANLILSIQRDEFGFDIDLERQPDLLDIPAFYQYGAGNFWVALEGGNVVGSIALKDIGEGYVALRKMFVAASHRGASLAIAANLLHTAVDWARRHAALSIVLGTTEKFHAAHRFYEKHGFSLVDKASLPARFPFMPVDTRFYRLELANALEHT